MALTDYEIQESDYTGNDISGLSDKPSLTAAQLKARFDSLIKNVVAVKFNALITALATTVSGLISKVSGGTEGNFASLTSGGEVQDSGYKAADFAAASHATDTDNPHAVTCAQLGALNKRVSYYWTSAYDLDVLLDSTMLVGSAVQNTSGLFALIGGGFAYITQLFYSGTTATNNRVQYAFGYSTDKMAMRRYKDTEGGWQDWQPVGAHREYSTSVTLSAIATKYDLSVSWATTSMWFDVITTDATPVGFLHFIRAWCASDGTVSLTLNQVPGATYGSETLNVKISGWL